VLEQFKLETKDEKYHVDRLEQGVVVAYDRIPKSVQISDPTTTQKIDHIVKTIDQYFYNPKFLHTCIPGIWPYYLLFFPSHD
jgi:hypothetical protein